MKIVDYSNSNSFDSLKKSDLNKAESIFSTTLELSSKLKLKKLKLKLS